jgi:hypothetical protein
MLVNSGIFGEETTTGETLEQFITSGVSYEKPSGCIKQIRREHFQCLVRRVLLDSNELWTTLPRVKSGKLDARC